VNEKLAYKMFLWNFTLQTFCPTKCFFAWAFVIFWLFICT
jgi:hypothetical protein